MTTLLLDADILAFRVASVSQKTYQFDPDAAPIVSADDWADVVPRIHSAIDHLTETLGTPKVIVCLSCPTPENWRLDVLPTYKGNRDYSKRPVHLAAVKDYMEANWPSYRRPRLEADDIMGILSTHPTLVPGRKVIVSEDKDMKTIPGWLFNPAKDTKPRHISDETADWWHMHQTVCGDVTDGYSGCPGAGPTAAEEVLTDGALWRPFTHTFKSGPRKGLEEVRWRAEDGLAASHWQRVVSLYERQGYTEADALVQARVARICRATDFDFSNKRVALWTPTTVSIPRPEAATA